MQARRPFLFLDDVAKEVIASKRYGLLDLLCMTSPNALLPERNATIAIVPPSTRI